MLEEKKLETKNYLKSALLLGTPIMLQGLLYNGGTFIDTLMIGQLGEASIAAVGVASQLYFFIMLFFFGVSSGSSIFISQYWGAGDRRGIQKVLGIGMLLNGSVSIIVALISTLYPSSIMHLFSYDPLVVAQGNSYLKVVGFSYIFTGISFFWALGFRSTGNARTPLLISIFCVSLNAIGNYLLIFGIGIFPEMGVAGAAISTSISRFIELMIYVVITTRHKESPMRLDFKFAFKFDKVFVKKFFKTCAPVIINEVFWALGMIFYKIAYSKIGTQALAAVQVVEAINNLFFVIIQGIANATAIIIGIKIGQGEERLARLYARYSMYLSFVCGVLITILIVFVSPQFLKLFNVSRSVSILAIYSMYVVAFLAPIKACNANIVVGVLRSGGDTKYSMYLEMGSVWLVGVPLAFLGSMVFHLTLPQIYLLVGCEEITKFIIGSFRIKSGKWYNNLTIL
ncbi:MAG: MATE family efflux transporter [Spirochaetaceae bacterium]|nr:MATE family efflux transporter [Spirochaetaceae bacterium]